MESPIKALQPADVLKVLGHLRATSSIWTRLHDEYGRRLDFEYIPVNSELHTLCKTRDVTMDASMKFFRNSNTINTNAFSNRTISSFGKWHFNCSQISNNLNRSFLLSPSNHLIQKHPIYDEIVIEKPLIGHAWTTYGPLTIQSDPISFQDVMSQSDHEF